MTRGQYAAFVADSGYAVANKCWTYEQAAAKVRSGRSFRNPGYEQTDNQPVVCVNWDDAQAYVQWLSRKTGAAYRLLSEAEWEYAARAGSQARFSFGNTNSRLCKVGNGLDKTARPKFPKNWTYNSCTDGYVYTAPVGSFAANSFGLDDMHGNVWEWTEDCYHESYKGAPADGAPWKSGECKYRVLRGGAWSNGPRGYVPPTAAGSRPATTRTFWASAWPKRSLLEYLTFTAVVEGRSPAVRIGMCIPFMTIMGAVLGPGFEAHFRWRGHLARA